VPKPARPGRESDPGVQTSVEKRRLVLDGRGVDLSRLGLDANSNVVEAVVSGLRRKMGDRAATLETVRGVGYRLGPLD
jgi:DNA-binding response OmpR family regulator